MDVISLAKETFASRFGGTPDSIGAAPGRIEFIGNHTDYNGGRVLGAAIDRQMVVAYRRRNDRKLLLASSGGGGVVEVSLDALVPLSGASSWANYPLGVLKVLIEAGLPADRGGEFAVSSDLPAGAGLSSSAAFELATAFALCAAWGWSADRAELAKLARKAENTFVGVPCGILDQGVSAFGAPGSLVGIDCRGPVFSTVPIPGAVRFWVFNSGVKHALLDSLYATRHGECHAAFAKLRKAYPQAGHLCELSPAQVESAAASVGLSDAELSRARHVVQEHARVDEVSSLLGKGDLAGVGRLLFASHASSRKLFENSTPELDLLVDTLSSTPHVLGARLTGGGFGGAVLAMTTPDFGKQEADSVVAAYDARFGHPPTVFTASTGPGARVVS